MSYTAKKLPETTQYAPAYRITGPKGSWTLERNVPHPEHLFVVNSKGHAGNVRGEEWFKEDIANCRLVAFGGGLIIPITEVVPDAH